MTKNHAYKNHAAFTLIEMMVVVTIIGILIAGVFRLMGAAGENNKKAVTIARMQRLQNALSGFYAEYGTYPPVGLYGSPDPFGTGRTDDFEDTLPSTLDVQGRSACWAAKAQPMAFEFPNGQDLDTFVNMQYQSIGVIGINQVLGQNAADSTEQDWKKIKMFKFGLLSYLLPRVTVVGFLGDNESTWPDGDQASVPKLNFYKSRQWTRNNPAPNVQNADDREVIKVLRSQRQKENSACARWMPNFERIIDRGDVFFGIDTRQINADQMFRLSNVDKDHCAANGKPYFSTEGGSKSLLKCMTVRDGWGSEIYYYSAPPYQSYRLWSSGPDKITFPPWISLQSLTGDQRKTVSLWIKDDVVRFDR
jgi:prepilin-type N-terminal cleavage/methylation domain-containing protein